MNFSEMPVEIWADMLEEQGEDTTELREWISSGLKIYESTNYHYNIGDSNSEEHADGRRFGYCYGNSVGYANAIGIGDGSNSDITTGHGLSELF